MRAVLDEAVARRLVGVASFATVSPVVVVCTPSAGVAAAFARVDALLRRGVATLVSCSELAVVVFSVFERVDRVRVVVGFTCSCISGDSDVSFMKKTPFCILARHIVGARVMDTRLPLVRGYASCWFAIGRRKSLFTAIKRGCRKSLFRI